MAETKDKAAPKNDAEKPEDVKVPATQEAGALVVDDDDDMYGSAESNSDFGQKDFTIPYIGIIQALSKAVQKTHANYVKGAEQGMFLNSATRQTYDGEKGFLFVPFYFQHSYKEWKPNNGGIANDYGNDPTYYESIQPITEEGSKDKGKRLAPNGNEVVDTAEYYGLIIDIEAQTMEPAVVGFSKMQMGKSRKWNNFYRAQMEKHPVTGKPFKPETFFYYYRLTTMGESNDKGAWYGFSVPAMEGKVPDLGEFGKDIFRTAKRLREEVKSGKLRAGQQDDDIGGGDAGDLDKDCNEAF